ncbi:heterokaryon incompatibility protein-domain-containing protein [Hypoxylon trugodes]|uniref:heterokaryon incompatibility protein-domain-containing protein n=1 Tax=Hypoxylon trugodes TaxID=326681 RepID=UPI00219F8289|nr:heterokaryon incompatibility protein-domain-containing protein [Hypoxylon trugodes]KAI1390762.1 heterokaryon incompatibility protein-domain-containing protein [Hypoxylon trugodes]
MANAFCCAALYSCIPCLRSQSAESQASSPTEEPTTAGASGNLGTPSVAHAVSTLAKEHTLCTQCREAATNSSLLPTLNKGEEDFRVYSNLRELQASSLEGCHLCSLFLGMFGFDIAQEQYESQVKVTLYVSRSGGAWLNVIPVFNKIRNTESPSNGSREQVVGEVTIFRDLEGRVEEPKSDSPFLFSDAKIYNNAQLSKSLSYEPSAILAKEWLKQCTQHHEECSLAATLFQADYGYPARLVYVGSGNDGVLRLVVTAELGNQRPNSRPEYLTLSHCWGGADILKLLDKRVDSFKKDIPFAELPRTFQDAVVITRQLGFRYLWIDSLCIIQDSPSDWRSESAIMGEIYAHSTCTIAALTARSSFEGCFIGQSDQGIQGDNSERNPLAFRICDLPHGLHAEFSQRLGPSLRLNPRKPFPLHTRAWVVQERLLAPRTLYYGSWGLAWECAECSATESNPFGERYQYSPKASFLKACVQLTRAVHAPVCGDKTDIYQMWLDVQASYSTCGLTFFDDRLVAVSSIIKAIERRTHWTNIWGLWKETLLNELVWFVETPSEHPQTKEYLCPSWSWLGIQGRVFAEMAAVNITPSWAAQVVEIGKDCGRGFIRLRAAIKEVFIPPDRKSDLADKSSRTRRAVSWAPDTLSPIAEQELSCVLLMKIPNYIDGHALDVGLVVHRVNGETTRIGRFWQSQGDTVTIFENEINQDGLKEITIF